MRCMGIDMGSKRVGVWMGEIKPATGTIVTYSAAIYDTSDPKLWTTLPSIVPAFFEVTLPFSANNKTTLLTERLIGLLIGCRFTHEQWDYIYFVTRPTIKWALLGVARGTDKDIRAALLDLYPDLAKDKRIKGDIWSAIAVAHTGAVFLQGDKLRKSDKVVSLSQLLFGCKQSELYVDDEEEFAELLQER